MPKLPKKPKEETVKPEVVAESVTDAIAEAPPAEEVVPEALPPPVDAAPLAPALTPATKPKIWEVTERKQFSYKGQILHLVPGSLLNEHHYDKDFFAVLKEIGLKLKEVV